VKKSQPGNTQGLAFFDVRSFEVASWSPGAADEGVPPTQVHVVLRVAGADTPLVLRLKSRAVCDSFIAALQEHRDYVWGAPAEDGDGRDAE
jgi:hypothetical protein